MRAVVYDAPRSFSVREIPTPDPGPGEVRIKVLACGVCGTDLHLHNGEFLANFPMTPGHETVGLIDAIGDGVSEFNIGEQVVVNPNSACGECSFCIEGRPLLCTHFEGIGSTKPGGFAEYLIAPVSQVFTAEGLDPEVAVFTEPTACACHGLDTIAPHDSPTALVLGAGPSGVLVAQLLHTVGGAAVTIAAPTQFKLDTARSLGVDATFTMTRGELDSDVQRLLDLSGGEGFDIVVEATGNQAVAQATLKLVRSGGEYIVYGVVPEDARIEVSPFELFRRELTIKGTFAEIDSFEDALRALRHAKARTTGMITHRFSLDQYGEALAALGDPNAHKIIIVP